MIRVIPPIAAALLLSGLYFETRTHPNPAAAAPFHERVRTLVDALPASMTVGKWRGIKEEVPPSAQALLRPNALFCRQFTNTDTNRTVSVVLVQCTEARDMGGHYPPRCYPSQGWTLTNTERVSVKVGDQEIPASRYTMTRPGAALERAQTLIVYDFFELPFTGPVATIEQVRKAEESYRARPFGAAQVQVVFYTADLTEPEEGAIASELLAPLAETFKVLGTLHPEKMS